MKSVGLAVIVALALAVGARAEAVAPGVRDGMVATAPNGSPLVAYVRGNSLEIATRIAPGHWRATRAHKLAAGSTLVAFAVGAAGPVALIRGGTERTLTLVRGRAGGWSATGFP